MTRRFTALRRSAEVALLGIAPILLVGTAFWLEADQGVVAEDFRHAFLPAARAVLHGESPYPGLHDPAVAAGAAYVYPPPAAVAAVPFGLIPTGVAVWLVTAVMLALAPVILAVVRVRDWRCYGAALLWAPVLSSIQTCNLSLVVALGAALAWRSRNSTHGAYVAGGIAAVKLFTWPLGVWLLFSGRTRHAFRFAVGGAATVLASWAVIRFADAAAYVDLARRLNELESDDAYTLFALARELGLAGWVAASAWLGCGLLLIASCARAARRGEDERSFAFAVLGSLALTPIVWLHYFALLLVPLAITRPRFGVAWLLPVALWIVPVDGNDRATWQTALVLGVAAAVGWLALAGGGRAAERRPGVVATEA